MANVRLPSDDHNRYLFDPSYLEERFGVAPLADLINNGVTGVGRYIVMPSFRGESIFTLTYRPGGVDLESAVAKDSLWDSLSGCPWTRPKIRKRSLTYSVLPEPLDGWSSLKEAARSAPSVDVVIIDGHECFVLDGVSFRHSIQDDDGVIHAQWHNPNPEASNHKAQMFLVNAYSTLLRRTRWPFRYLWSSLSIFGRP